MLSFALCRNYWIHRLSEKNMFLKVIPIHNHSSSQYEHYDIWTAMSSQPLDIEIQISEGSSGWAISTTELQDMKIWIKKQKWQKQVLNQCRSLFSNMVMVLCLLRSAFGVDFMKWLLLYFMVLLVLLVMLVMVLLVCAEFME